MSAMKEHAIWYAKHGWPIFPCKQLEKVPDCVHGCLNGTTDLNQIEAWWNQNPNRNIGLLCGSKGGVYVIDIDVRPGEGTSGFESLREFPPLPDTCAQGTPRNGVHALYSWSNLPGGDTIRNKNHWRPGLDIRSDGYYIVLSPSIVTGGNRYAWKSDRAPWEFQLAEFPSFMYPPATIQTSSQPTLVIPEAHCEDRLRRASAYLAKIDAAVQGKCGHNKLLWAAQCLTHGFLLSDEEAFNMLALEYNPRCDPPWDMSSRKDHKDFCRKIHEARKNPPRHPKGWLLAASLQNEPTPQLLASVKSLLGTVKKEKSVKSVPAPAIITGVTYAYSKPTLEEFKFVTNPFGYLGKFCSWVNNGSRRPQPILSLGGTLAFFGALFGRKVKDKSGARTNVYCMGIGQSSAGKQHVQDCVRKVVEEVGCHKLLGACGFGSDTAIENTLARHPSVVFMLDEIGHILMNLKSKPMACTEKIIETLMRVWSSTQSSYTPKAYADDESEKRVIQPCLSIYGTSTQDRFIEGVSTSELNDGWLSRCLVFHTDTFPFKEDEYSEPHPPDEICEFVDAWAKRRIEPKDKETVKAWQKHVGDDCEKAPPTQLFVPTDDRANAMFKSFDLFSREVGEESPVVKCLWAKAEENARKCALTIATSTNYDNPVIDTMCADYGIKLSSFLLRSFGFNMVGQISSSAYEEKKNKIWTAINKRGVAGCSRVQLANSAGWANKRERMEMVEDLREAGRIVTKSVNGDSVYWSSRNLQGG